MWRCTIKFSQWIECAKIASLRGLCGNSEEAIRRTERQASIQASNHAGRLLKIRSPAGMRLDRTDRQTKCAKLRGPAELDSVTVQLAVTACHPVSIHFNSRNRSGLISTPSTNARRASSDRREPSQNSSAHAPALTAIEVYH